MPGKRIVFTAIGSLGDIHPSIAVGLGLQARGHDVVIATGECYRAKVEALGLGFRPLRPNSDFVTDPLAMPRFMDFRWGTFRILRELVLPTIRDSYDDTQAAVADGADLLIAHPLCFATRLVAEKNGIPWVSTQITPVGLFSAFNPPLPPGYPDLVNALLFLGPWFWGPLGQSLKWATMSWARSLTRLRAEIGLPPSPENPLVDGHSPGLVLALFSEVLAAKQPDWPPQVVHTGFPFHDRDGGQTMTPELASFLDDGPPPIVFTLGITAAMVAGDFFEQSVTAAKKLGRRAVLVTGRRSPARLPTLPDDMIAVEYVPFSDLFSRSCAVVHAGGIGTTGLAMKAGRPMLVVPHAHDQPDNAARLTRLGVARMIWPHRYSAKRVETELRQLLEDPRYTTRAAEVSDWVGREDGVRAACDALEGLPDCRGPS